MTEKSLDPKYKWLWFVWILAFLGIEWAALRNSKPGDTLSEVVRKHIGSNNPQRTWGMWMARILLGGLFAWLIPHFYSG